MIVAVFNDDVVYEAGRDPGRTTRVGRPRLRRPNPSSPKSGTADPERVIKGGYMYL